MGTVHGAVGTELTDVTLTGSNQHILVTSVADKTFAPGAQVQISRPHGTNGHVILGDPPAGSGGGSGFSLRSLPAPPKPGRRYVGYYMDTADDVMLAWVYKDGVYQADLEILEFSDLIDFSAIVADPAHKVQPGSVAFVSGEPPTTPRVLHVWDPTTGAVYDHEAATGHILSSGCWLAGYVYWFDSDDHSASPPPHETTVTLYRARADFSGIESVGSVTVPIPGGLTSVAWEIASIQLSTVAAETQATALDDVDHEVAFTFGIRVALNGTADAPVTASVIEFGIPEGGGGSFRQRGQGSDASIFRRPSTLGAAYAQHWPTSAAWAMQAYIHCGTSADLATAFTYGVPNTDTGIFALYVAPSVAPFGDKPTVITVGIHPTVGQPPTYFVAGY